MLLMVHRNVDQIMDVRRFEISHKKTDTDEVWHWSYLLKKTAGQVWIF